MKKRMKRLLPLLLTLVLLAGAALAGTGVFAAGLDPTGASYADSVAAGDTAVTAAKALLGANYTWIMLCAFLVFFFQCGFAMVETGFCRAKNAAHTMTMNFMVFLVGAVGYFLCGFALQMGGSGGAAGLGPGTAALNALAAIPGFGGLALAHLAAQRDVRCRTFTT